ncbi:MAG: HutP family protein [Bacillota bacterium]|nr:hut operon transcriptional regulator HutP [Bacillota bacterium]MDW7730501.1 HutP family protein [Bacillota bacterium]
MSTLGSIAIGIAIAEAGEAAEKLINEARELGYRAIRSQVGSMSMDKVIAAIETASRREGIISDTYHQEHALYHAIIDALLGVCRGQLELGNIVRTVGLSYSVVCGPIKCDCNREENWIMVVLYGTIGAPIKGFEHEAIGLGTYHIDTR